MVCGPDFGKSRAGVPNLFSTAYHQIVPQKFAYHQIALKNFAYHFTVSFCSMKVIYTAIFIIKSYQYYLLKIKGTDVILILFLVGFMTNCKWKTFLLTTWDLSTYHQWYAYHRLGTPGLEIEKWLQSRQHVKKTSTCWDQDSWNFC
jgi:hypothetical protein